ncbi:glycoside hydrolase domain-containing protein [Kitasatospora griseola]|uniref:glycoside hydrolase domain-containing protein n=1 Tax=Kitasatospora griseola TaxID=2064 RepID=UPI003812722A
MTTQYGVDYPWSKPPPAALHDAGVAFVMRYLSKDASKNLSIDEANSLAAVGIWCGVVWETTAGRALDGRAAGAADAREAVRQAAACGMPDGRPIYFAVDTDTTWPRVAPYFQGVCDVLPADQVGVYGGIRIVAAAADSGLARWYWQAEAWSGGRWEPRAHIRQAGGARIGGVDVDNNTAVTGDFGQWMPGRPYSPTNTPAARLDRRRLDEEVR